VVAANPQKLGYTAKEKKPSPICGGLSIGIATEISFKFDDIYIL
jgi:hypothetical protein